MSAQPHFDAWRCVHDYRLRLKLRHFEDSLKSLCSSSQVHFRDGVAQRFAFCDLCSQRGSAWHTEVRLVLRTAPPSCGRAVWVCGCGRQSLLQGLLPRLLSRKVGREEQETPSRRVWVLRRHQGTPKGILSALSSSPFMRDMQRF